MHESSEKVIRTVSHTFPKLGSGAMGSRFREQLTSVFIQLDQWNDFLSAMVTAHDLLCIRDHEQQVQSRRADVERPQARPLSRTTRRASCPTASGQKSFHCGSNGSTKTLKLC